MSEWSTGTVKARLKTLEKVIEVFPDALKWKMPDPNSKVLFPPADIVIKPFLGKTVLLRVKQMDIISFLYEIVGTGGLVVMPNWIDHFETKKLVHVPRKKDFYGDELEPGDHFPWNLPGRIKMIEGIVVFLR